MDKLNLLLKKEELLVAGLMSGTSADGIDACLVKIKQIKGDLRVKPLKFKTYEYPQSVKQKIFELSQSRDCYLDELVRLNMLLGEKFGQAVATLCREAGIEKERVDLVGSHGQTIRHLPKAANFCGEKVKGTLQIGDPSVIAARTGIPTVGDFRVADMALGGQGAPLCPLAHFHLFRDKDFSRAILNIGGIANITLLARRCEMDDLFAFDTGPGNVLIDNLAKRLYDREYDKDGRIALKGKVNRNLLRKLKENSYFEKRPPKSTGREDFEKDLEYILNWKRIPQPDIMATVSELTCWSIFDAYKKWVEDKARIDQLVMCGGGCHNRYIVKRLSMLFHPVKVISCEELGYDPDQIEAICFAILAYLTVKGKAGNLKRVTGAKKEIRLGKICLL